MSSADSRGTPELKVCSQNLNNLGVRSKRSKKKIKHLVKRIVDAGCDVVAVQEVGGANKKAALRTLRGLGGAISEATGRSFQAFVGDTMDERIRNGFLVSKEAGLVVSSKSFAKGNVPKLTPWGPSRYYARGPYLIHLRVPGQGKSVTRDVLLLSIHLKSKANSWKDPTQTSFETLRMEMAEGVRQLAEKELRRVGEESVFVVLGDRNSEEHSASTDVLSGRRELSDFRRWGTCRLDQSLKAECSKESRKTGFVPLLELTGVKSYRYRGEMFLYDEIFVSEDDRWMFIAPKTGLPQVGTEGVFSRGSDHKLIWATVNW